MHNVVHFKLKYEAHPSAEKADLTYQTIIEF